MPSTANYALPYPTPADPVDVPGDIQALAEATDLALDDAITNGVDVLSNVTAISTTTGTVTLDFSVKGYRTHALTGNIIYASSNVTAGSSVTVRVSAGGSTRTLSFPVGWTFVSPKPTELLANKVAILTATAFGAGDSNVVAAWAAQA